MKKYETVIIFDPTIDEGRVSAKLEDLQRRITEGGGQVESTNHWGKRKLAYPMEKKENGTYVVVQYATEGSRVAEIERALRLDDAVLRHMTVVRPDEALVQAAAQAAERAAQRRTRGREEED